MVVLHGRYEIDIEGELSMLEAGDAVFVGAGVEHRWRRCGGPKSRAITMIRESGAGGQGSGQPPGT
jgi:mannose-6-phosphate isomerase-like protein (cupin superfamily)